MKSALIACAGILLVSSAAASCAGLVTVVQRSRSFATASVQVDRGDTVRFLNDDTFLHQIYVDSPGLKFESAEQEPGKSVDVRFAQPGTFRVLCHIHPKMVMQVEAR